MGKRSSIKYAAPFIPYAAVLLGLYAVHNVWVAAVSYHLAAGAVLWIDGSWRKKDCRTFADRRLLIPLNLLIGVCTGLILYALWPILGVSHDFGNRLSQMGLTSWTTFGIYYCAINPITEELLWRRFLDTSTTRPSSSEFLFAGYHMLVLVLFVSWQWLPVAFSLLVLAAWIWKHSARHRHGTLLVTASHFLADLGIVLAASLYAGRH